MDKNSKKAFEIRKLAARIYSAFVWNRDARRAFRNALVNDYDLQIRELVRSRDDANAKLEVLQKRCEKIDDTHRAFHNTLVNDYDLQIRELVRSRDDANAKLEALQKRCEKLENDLRKHLAPPPVSPYRIEGKDNRVIIVEEDGRERLLGKNERVPGLEISICGDDNEIRIHRPSTLWESKIQIGCAGFKNNFARVELGKGITFSCVFLRINAGERQCFRFGDKSRIWGGEIILDETSGCIIGNDCNCSNNIHIWGSDAHAILDKNDPEKILNEVTGPITVGDHCWIGQAVRLQKNARVPANTIIAAGAIVTKAFDEEYTILAGVPAKVIKRGVMREPKTQSAYHLKKARARAAQKENEKNN